MNLVQEFIPLFSSIQKKNLSGYRRKKKRNNTGEESKTSQLPVLRTSYKTDDNFSGYITIKSCTLKEMCTLKTPFIFTFLPVLKGGKNKLSRFTAFC